MTSESTVYFAQELISPTNGKQFVLDTSSAARYGTIKNVLTRQSRPSLAPGPCLVEAKKALAKFNHTTDYITVAGGDPLALSIAMLALRDLGFRRVNFLRWDKSIGLDGKRDRSSGYYTPVSVPLD